MRVSMEYCAQYYLNQWFANEQDLYHRLKSKDLTDGTGLALSAAHNDAALSRAASLVHSS